jgi:allantoicase
VTHSSATPDALANLTDLSLDATGTFVLYATDDYFAPKECLVRPGAPEWREGAYTDKGKWMDGWESRRRRSPGHDFVIVRLGTPGTIEGVLCDTTHFKGNAPQEVSLEAVDVPASTSVDELLALPVTADPAVVSAARGRAWLEVVPRMPVKPDHPNALAPVRTLRRTSHVRLRIHPDGGVARLRVYGRVVPDPDVFRGPGSVDLAAIENGGTIAAASDSFFGPPANLLLPGRGVNMGDGWETKRRRTPGSDWCVIRLGRRGIVHRLELDTHFFKGNAPVAASVESLDGEELTEGELRARLASEAGWQVLVEDSPVEPHHRHLLAPAHAGPVTHLRVHIVPHGGVNRLRVHGEALDTPGERRALAALHALQAKDAAALRTLLLSFCGSSAFVDRLAAVLPAPSVRALLASASAALVGLRSDDLLEAFAAHPRLGEGAAAKGATAQSSAWSEGEQAALARGATADLERLRAGNVRYFERFGFVFLAFASGRGAGELADLLERRLANDRETEMANAAVAQARITRLRIARWLEAHGAE